MELLELWERRRVQFEQCMELQLFNRDCEHADATMSKQEVGIHLSDLVVYHLTLKNDYSGLCETLIDHFF